VTEQPVTGQPVTGQVAFLHVPKTGGTAVKAAIEGVAWGDTPPAVEVFGHSWNLGRLAGHRVFFVVRDPVDRAVSAYASRQREGRPRYHYPHSAAEAEVFGRWDSFEKLVLAVDSGDPDALAGYQSIAHLRPLSTWLVDVASIEASNICYIAEMASLSAEWDTIRRVTGMPESATLPTSAVAAHRAPEPARPLSPHASAIARSMLTDDYRLYEACLKVREDNGWA